MAVNRDLTKRQHYHMRAILKNFSLGENLSIYYKDGSIGKLTYEDKAFYGHIAWSDETETRYGATIEKRVLGQIRHILNTHGVSDHKAISEYHMFWRLRHMYAVDPEPATKIYEGFNSGTDEELKDAVNRYGKICINGDGTIDGMFAATLRIKAGLELYRAQYDRAFWSVGISKNGGLISADNYRSSLIFPLSPHIFLYGTDRKKKKPWIMTDEETTRANQMAKDECHSFCFGKPTSDDARPI